MPKSVKWAVGLLALLWSCASLAQTYPIKPVRIIVPYQAGQGTDVVARYLAEHLSRTLGQRFYVETSREPAAISAPSRRRTRTPTATRC
jgi:tripartite-type tricarboxylate transporter receptor subunit TctC